MICSKENAYQFRLLNNLKLLFFISTRYEVDKQQFRKKTRGLLLYTYIYIYTRNIYIGYKDKFLQYWKKKKKKKEELKDTLTRINEHCFN